MNRISKFANLRNSLLDLLARVSACHDEIESKLGQELVNESVFNSLKEDLQNTNFVVAVVGVIKRGKSTLLNAILGLETEVLSTGVTPETARLSFLIYSDEPFAIVHTKDGKTLKISIDDLPKYTSSYTDGVARVSRGVKELVESTTFAEIHLPNDYLKDGIRIVDTPGVDDPDESRSQVTEQFIAKADAVVFLIDVLEGGLKKSELAFLKGRIINNRSSKGIIVGCNKILALRRHQVGQLEKLIADTKAKLEAELTTDIPVYPIDALAAFQAKQANDQVKYAKSGFGEFTDGIEKMLVDNRGRILIQKGITSIRSKCIGQMLDRLEFERRLLTDRSDDYLSQLDQLKTDLSKIKLRKVVSSDCRSQESPTNRSGICRLKVQTFLHKS